MEKRLLIVPIVLLLTLATVACAGCPNVVTVSPSPTPTVSASPTTTVTTNATPANMSAFLTAQLQDQGYSILKPLTKGSQATTGNDIYTGTIAVGASTFNVGFEICKSVYESQVRFRVYENGFLNSNYTTTSSSAYQWVGKNVEGNTALVNLNTQNQVVEVVS